MGDYRGGSMMRELRLLLYLVFGLILGATSVLAFAEDYPAPLAWSYGWTSGSGGSHLSYATPDEACMAHAVLAGWTSGGGTPGVIKGPGNNIINGETTYHCFKNDGYFQMDDIAYVAGCYPGAGTFSGGTGSGTCEGAQACVSPQIRDSATGQCVDPPNPCELLSGVPVGKTIATGYYADPPLTLCHGGCQISGWGFSACLPDLDYCQFEGARFTGDSCTTDPVSTDPPITCPDGQVPVEINGQTKCALPGTQPGATTTTKQTTTQTKTDPGGATSTTTTTTTTVCNVAGSCTTTTTINNTGGGATGGSDPSGGADGETTVGTEQGVDGYCTDNPSAPICQDGSSLVDPGTDELYTQKEATLSGVVAQFTSDIQQTPMVGAVQGFFVISAGGSCPSFGGSVPWFGSSISLSFPNDWCGWPEWDWLQAAMLIAASFAAFRIAVY